MKLETGMYVRTRDGIVKIAENVQELKNEGYVFIDNKAYYSYEIFKASFNLIDLIEVGDYVNGYRVKQKFGNDGFLIDVNYQKNGIDQLVRKENIELILTHEQYEANCYKVVE